MNTETGKVVLWVREVEAAQQPLVNRVRLLAGKGTLHRVNDGPNVQTIQATFLAGETRDGMERVQDYGFTSVPLAGMQPIALFMGGDRSNGVVIAMADRQYRLKALRGGEVALYDDLGQKVHLTREGVVVETPLDATVQAAGNITVKAGKTLRLEGNQVEVHATESFRFDVAGHGQHWFPDHVDTWTIGAIAGTPHPITPPEIG